ncbi:MAG: hypothetical protein WBL45_13600 [Solirubrobacterales bacterium]
MPADVTREAGAVTRQAGTRAPDSSAVASPGGSVRSVEPHRPAPLRGWRTHVWPAIALGPFGGLLTDLPAGPEGATLALLSGGEVSRLLLGLTASTTTGDSSTGTASGLSSASPADTGGIPLPGGGEIPFFVVIAFAAVVMALLMGAVRRELGALYRWWPH